MTDTTGTTAARPDRIVRVRWEKTETFKLDLPESQVKEWLGLPAGHVLTVEDIANADSGMFEDRLVEFEYDPDGDDAFEACTDRTVTEREIITPGV